MLTHIQFLTRSGPTSFSSILRGQPEIDMNRRFQTQICISHGAASSMHSRFGLRYVEADAWDDKCWATRQAGKSGLAAIQRVDKLQQNLALLRVPAHVGTVEVGVPANVGPVEERCYQLQRLLGPDEQQRWIAVANATADVYDDAIRALETAAARVGGETRSLVRPSPRALDNIYLRANPAHLRGDVQKPGQLPSPRSPPTAQRRRMRR